MEDPRHVYKELFVGDPVYNSHDSNHGFSYEIVIKTIDGLQVSSCLDVGSGRGIMLDYFKRFRPEIALYSCDLEKFHTHDVGFVEINLFTPETLDKVSDAFPVTDIMTCLDVMEHVPPIAVRDVFNRLAKLSKIAMFTIANHPDIQNGVELHLTQEREPFWLDQMKDAYDVLYDESFQFGPNFLYYFLCRSKAFPS